MSHLMEKQSEKQAVKPPQMWTVVLINDDFTTFEFVMGCLITVFNKNEQEAFQITTQVHQQGKGVVGIYTKDIGESKVAIAQQFALQEAHPLMILLEPA